VGESTGSMHWLCGWTISEHLADRGYTTAEALAESKTEFGVTVIGEVTDNKSWQENDAAGFGKAQFVIDWERQTATCPNGKETSDWKALPDGKTRVRFKQRDCSSCPFKAACTKGVVRYLSLHPREHEEALQAARARQQTQEFKEIYAKRAGVEGTISQSISRGGRRTPYIGIAKTRLRNLLVATGINTVRFAEWCIGTPLAKTRVSRFAALRTA
jgi:transposase